MGFIYTVRLVFAHVLFIQKHIWTFLKTKIISISGSRRVLLNKEWNYVTSVYNLDLEEGHFHTQMPRLVVVSLGYFVHLIPLEAYTLVITQTCRGDTHLGCGNLGRFGRCRATLRQSACSPRHPSELPLPPA